MNNTLTARQQELFEYLKHFQNREGVMPSTREIQSFFGFASQTAAMSHLRALEKKGAIIRLAGKARAVIFPADLEREPIVDIPVYGSIAAGMAETVEQEQEACISIDTSSLGISQNTKTFALKVRGDSMINAHICSGDTVILEQRSPKNKDIVAALIDGETTLKRFLVEGGKTFLRAENEDFADLIPARELSIQGVMIGLLRRK